MKKNIVRLTESQLQKVIKNSVQRILKEAAGLGYEASMQQESELRDMVYNLAENEPSTLAEITNQLINELDAWDKFAEIARLYIHDLDEEE